MMVIPSSIYLTVTNRLFLEKQGLHYFVKCLHESIILPIPIQYSMSIEINIFHNKENGFPDFAESYRNNLMDTTSSASTVPSN